MFLFILQDFEQNKIKYIQRSFEDFIDTCVGLIDADIGEQFLASFSLPFRILPGLAYHTDNFARGVHHISFERTGAFESSYCAKYLYSFSQSSIAGNHGGRF